MLVMVGEKGGNTFTMPDTVTFSPLEKAEQSEIPVLAMKEDNVIEIVKVEVTDEGFQKASNSKIVGVLCGNCGIWKYNNRLHQKQHISNGDVVLVCHRCSKIHTSFHCTGKCANTGVLYPPVLSVMQGRPGSRPM